MRKIVSNWLIFILIFSLFMLIPDVSNESAGQNITTQDIFIIGTGNISCVWFDNPIFVIKADDGKIYLPSKLSPNLQYLGTPVRFAGHVKYSEFTNGNQTIHISLRAIADEDFFQPKTVRFSERMSFPIPLN